MSDYWQKRALADEALAHRSAQQTAAQVQKVYQRQYDIIMNDMAQLYAQMQAGQTPTRTQLWNFTRWKRLESDLSAFSTKTSKQFVTMLTNSLNGVFKQVIGVDMSRYLGDNAVHITGDPTTAVNTAWSGECFSARIWQNNAAIAQRIETDIQDMIVGGRSISEVRRKVMQDFSVAYSDAQRLVHTEHAYVANNAAKQRYKTAGLTKVKWCAVAESDKTCEICRERHGKVWVMGTEPSMPAHPNCRCVWQGVVELPGETVEADGEIV